MTNIRSLRQAIAHAIRLPEPYVVKPLLALAQLSPQAAQKADALARRLIQGMREGPGPSGRAGRVQSLMQEFALSSEEGVALMCLAEALLRIPDSATRDALIRDKISGGNWQLHTGHSSSLFVNAASWGLVLTGKLVATHSEGQLLSALTRLIGKQGEPLIRSGMQLAMQMLGEQFVTGETIQEALKRSQDMEARGFRYSYDMLGEAALTETDALRYFKSYQDAIHAIGQSAKGKGVLAGAGISIKLSALHPRYSRAQQARVFAELLPRVLQLAELAKHYNMGLNIDAEESERLEISLDLLEALCHAPSLSGWHGLGFVIQAYQKRCPYVVDYLLDLAKRSGHRLMIRLVKGAYWDSEIKRAQLEGQTDYPVLTRKHHTDVSYLACARKLLAAVDVVYPQFATHNAQTLASIVSMAEEMCGAYQAGQYEFQCLHGMGEPLYFQVVGAQHLSRPCRIYAPVGTHETLLAYLVRRLLENGANSSFVNRMADDSVSLDSLVMDPVHITRQEAAQNNMEVGQVHPQIPLPLRLYGANRLNSKGWDLNHDATLNLIQQAVENDAVPLLVKPMVHGLSANASAQMLQTLVNPANHSQVLGTLEHASADTIEMALQAADAFASIWAQTSPSKRAECLEKSADLLEAETLKCISLLVREAGKTWAHAVAEVREAVDFLRYYAAQVRRDFSPSSHQALGPVVCISPWNFPLAIFVGQVSAALAAGNPVLAKPAEQTSGIAVLAVNLMWQAGVPTSALQLLPGLGKTVGNALVQDARVQGVLFTGSTETAKLLQLNLSQRLNRHGQVVPLIAETGGQNCMVVDSSALLEQVVGDAVASAFEAAGQRCSALRVLCVQHEVADKALGMLKGAMAELSMGNPLHLETDIGPVIDARARDGIEAHIAKLQAAGRSIHRVHHADVKRPEGTYVSPTLIEINSLQDVEREVFGPVLHLLRYERAQLPHLLKGINATGYGLTLGVHSRIDETIDLVVQGTHAGNTYVNRNMVGAVVGVQPFGGEGLSGTGPKAGGPLYLLRLLAQCPEDAALQSVQAVGGGPLMPVTPALQALHTWALSQQKMWLAHQCARGSACNPAGLQAQLTGPTGERNDYQVRGRSHIACWVGSQDAWQEDLLAQLAAVLTVGARAVVQPQVKEFIETLPLAVQGCIDVRDAGALTSIQTALIHANEMDVLSMSQSLAMKVGALVSLSAFNPGDFKIPLARLVYERSISVNTAAAGGNASLMTL
jgi:RHH-type proline utilization regulon transcriptional repressor/proline dehydrogenase/delta 1-pyrroline-5-carboxylate dehydrogenase